ncbi:MAG: NAD(+) diphosphatase [Treponema sp.]|jgi:NAD+ diphosphatase|nr:NAD(+) diphosphatase [Treponema sp.]
MSEKYPMNTHGLFFQKNALLLPAAISGSRPDWEIPLDHLKEFESYASGAELFEINGTANNSISFVMLPAEAPLPPGWQAVPVRQTLSLFTGGTIEGESKTGRMFRAFHIAQWRRDSQFCGSCGTANTDAPGELARLCPACGRLEYPRIAPAVTTIISNSDNKILLAHNRKFAPGVYSLIAGFNEAGESLEATVAREIREEVNIEVSDIRYISSQPWPFPHSLMLGFSARYASGTILPDGNEIEEAGWFDADSMPTLPNPGSLSRYLIDQWLMSTSRSA